MIKAYFFDWMKTLADVENDRWSQIIKNEEHQSLLVKSHSRAQDTFREGRRDIIDDCLLSASWVLYPDSEEIIRELKERGYGLGIISDMYEVTYNRVREQFYRFIDFFDVFTASCKEGISKSCLDLYITAIEDLNCTRIQPIKPSEIVMIGDNRELDIEPALKLGMQARLIDRTKQSLRDVI